MSRVLDGGDVYVRGGTADKSSDNGVLEPLDSGLDAGDVGGEVFRSAMMEEDCWLTGKQDQYRSTEMIFDFW